MIKNILKVWPLILIAALGVVFRLYNLESLLYFTYDESIPAFIGKNFYLLGKLPLIGGVTPFDFHLPPYFYWFLSVTLSAGKLNPISWGITAALLSSVTVLLFYKVGSEFFTKKVGIFASIIWTFSYIANIYDRHLWALYWGPIICLSTLYSLKKIIEGNKRYVLLLSFVFIWSIATDPSNLIFIILSVLIYFLYKIKISRTEVISACLVLASLLPLVVFDIRHNLANTKPFFDYLKEDKSASRFENQNFISRSAIFTNSFVRLVYPFTDNEISKQYSYCPALITEKYEKIPSVLKIFFTAALACFIFYSLRPKNKGKMLIALTLTLYFIGVQLYGILINGDIFEHYLTGLFPIFILVVAICLAKAPKKISFVLLGLFLVLNLYKLSSARNSHGLTFKREAVEFTMSQVGKKDFSLESLSTCWRYSGYRYLFALYGREPIKSYVDPNFGYLYGTTQIASEHPDTVVSIVTHDFLPETDDFYKKYALFKSYEKQSEIFGNLEVIIMDNSKAWF